MDIIKKYAALLVDYCLSIQEGEKLYINSTTVAEPLVREVYRTAMNRGAIVETDLSFMGMNRIFIEEASTDAQLRYMKTLYSRAMTTFDAYLAIRAPFNLMENQATDKTKLKKRKEYALDLQKTYFRRTGNGELKRSLCQYPTVASAQLAGMSLEEYSDFIYEATGLYEDDPVKYWLGVRQNQQGIVDMLMTKSDITYKNNKTDISFSVKDRIWINSDGKSNMPSGEVFTGPVEDSINGVVYFNYPSIYMGHEVSGITLWVENGEVKKWEAEHGAEILDQVFQINGSRYFGEVAIGTNYKIQRATKNILFDEKIGGTIHMAVGQSYAQTGGKNESAIHWDMITDMKDGGEIWADGELIYQDGKFL